MTNHPNRKQVVTYRGAYIGRQITLCSRHANSTDARMVLGPVQHGKHSGRCDVCAALDFDARMSKPIW